MLYSENLYVKEKITVYLCGVDSYLTEQVIDLEWTVTEREI